MSKDIKVHQIKEDLGVNRHIQDSRDFQANSDMHKPSKSKKKQLGKRWKAETAERAQVSRLEAPCRSTSPLLEASGGDLQGFAMIQHYKETWAGFLPKGSLEIMKDMLQTWNIWHKPTYTEDSRALRPT